MAKAQGFGYAASVISRAAAGSQQFYWQFLLYNLKQKYLYELFVVNLFTVFQFAVSRLADAECFCNGFLLHPFQGS